MRRRSSLAAAVVAATATSAFGGLVGASASAATAPAAALRSAPSTSSAGGRATGIDHAVFVQTNNVAGNQIIAYHRSATGALTRVHTYGTGGRGGALLGGPTDPLASQGSLVYDAAHRELLAVNAGSNTITVFGVSGDRLRRRQVLPSGGTVPISITTRADLAYVLNAGYAGSISGFAWRADGRLTPLARSTRSLGLANPAVPNFLKSPAQIGFTPDGAHLIVPTKTNATIDVFGVGATGRPTASPVRNPAPGTVPFSFVFDPAGRLILNQASGAESSFTVNSDNTLTPVDALLDNGQVATCWIVRAGSVYYAVNTGSDTITGFRSVAGRLSLLDPSGVTARTAQGPIDIAASAGGRFLYVQDGVAGALSAYRVGRGGALTGIGTIGGLPVITSAAHGMEGIVAS